MDEQCDDCCDLERKLSDVIMERDAANARVKLYEYSLQYIADHNDGYCDPEWIAKKCLQGIEWQYGFDGEGKPKEKTLSAVKHD